MFGGVDAYLDIAPDHTLTHVIQSFDRLDLTLLKRSITRHSSGLYVLPHPTAIQEAAAIDPETLRRLFGLLRAAYSTVVIDTSKGLQSSDFSAFEISDVILVVVQLDLLCLRNTSRLLGLFREYDGTHRSGQAGGESERLVGVPDQPQEGRGDPQDADLLEHPQFGQGVSGGTAQGSSLERGRQGKPASPGLSRDGPIAAARSLRTESPKPRRKLFAAFF